MATEPFQRGLRACHCDIVHYSNIGVALTLSMRDQYGSIASGLRAYHRFEIDTPHTSHLDLSECGCFYDQFEV